MTTTVALGEVAELNPREPARPALDEPVSFVPMADLDAERATAGPGVDRPFAEVQKGYTVFRDQDVLVAKITPCFENGKIGQAQLRRRFGVGSTEFHVVRPRPDRLDPRYALHFLRQQRVLDAGERRMTGSAGQRRVPLAFLQALQLPLPPLEEQRRIATILDQADALRAKRRQSLALLDDLTQSAFLDMVVSLQTQPRRLMELGCDFTAGRNLVALTDASDGNRVIKVSAVSGGTFDGSESKALPASYVPPESHRIHHGDVLFARASGSLDLVGATALVEDDPQSLFLPDKVWRLELSVGGELTKEFMLAVLQSRRFKEYVRHNSSGAAGVRNISKAKVLAYSMQVPSEQSQIEFSARALAIRALRYQARRHLEESESLAMALQTSAFSGDL